MSITNAGSRLCRADAHCITDVVRADARTRGRMLFEGEWYADIGYEVGSSVAMNPPTSPATVQMVSFIFISPFLILGIKIPPVV